MNMPGYEEFVEEQQEREWQLYLSDLADEDCDRDPTEWYKGCDFCDGELCTECAEKYGLV